MKSLNTLIKIHNSELDELRKQIVKCEEDKERLIYYNNKMEEELAVEHNLASKDPEMGIVFANYRRLIRDRQAVIAASLQDLSKQIEKLKDDITLKFGEVKKFEIILANKLLEETKQSRALETRQLDEIAVNNFLKAELKD